MIGSPPGLKYVDRNSAGYDFDMTDFILDGVYHDLDLSQIVPDNAKIVKFSVLMKHPSASVHFKLKCKGSNTDAVTIYTIVGGVPVQDSREVPCTGGIEYEKESVAGWVNLDVAVLGWWI